MDKYNLFICWSKNSKGIAQIFHDMLQKINNFIKPYMSSEDINKGKNWDKHV
jgi:hypothetical protein